MELLQGQSLVLCRFAETLHYKKGLQTIRQSGVKLFMRLLVRKNHLKRLMKNVHLGKASRGWDTSAVAEKALCRTRIADSQGTG